MDANSIVTKAMVCKEIITIDPGKSNGGIVKFNGERFESWPIKKMENFESICDFFKYQAEICKLPLIFLEKITSFTKDYSDPKNRGRIFQMNKLKDHYVELKSAIKVSKMQFIEVMPYHWQKYINVHISNEESQVRKQRFKDIAKDWYQGQNIVGWNADAYLMVEFAQKKLKYDPMWIHNKLKENQIKPKSLWQ